MDRRTSAAACLAALITVGAALPWLGLAPRTAAASCSGWSSETEPPPTIRVFRHISGEVDTVDFRAYTKNVLSREWIASWTTESLRSGALAVKHYAWYQVLHWRGGVNSAGECFDLRDDTYDQVYDPSKPTWSTAAAAVDAMWGTRVLKNGAIFPTYYNAGAVNEPCGANANGWKAYQWGTQACGLAGSRAAEIILVYYYPGVTVTDAPAPTGTPTPTASPTPVATASPTPAATPTPTPGSSATPTPAASAIATPTATPPPTPAAGATPVPSPMPTPLPTPPPVQELPGGGQSSVADAAAPPPPPPPSPKPVVAAPEGPPAAAPVAGRSAATIPRMLEWSDPANVASVQVTRWLGGMLRANGYSRPADALRPDDRPRFDLRLALFDSMWEAALRQLVDALARDLGTERALALGSLLGRPAPASILTLGEVQQAEGWIVDPRRHASHLVLP